jgi:perosamine synthetase
MVRSAKLALLGGAPVIDAPAHPRYQLVRPLPLASRFAAAVGARFALPVASGTAALYSALVGAGVEPGDEVITVAHTWYSTATSVLSLGAVPVFVDVDPRTFTIDARAVEAQIGPRTRAVLGVSLYGHPIDHEALAALARRHGLVLIDDACQAAGARVGPAKVGALADLTAFSFSGVKPLAATGGGMVTCEAREYYERALLAGQHPSTISTEVRDPERHALASTGGYGHNFRIDGRCAERVYEQLETLELITTSRRVGVAALDDQLRGVVGLVTPHERPGCRHVYHMYTLLVDEAALAVSRDELLAALVAEGVPAIAYTSGQSFVRGLDGAPTDVGPLHGRRLFRTLAETGRCGPYVLAPEARIDSWRVGGLPVSEDLTRREINIQQRWLDAPFDAPEHRARIAEAIVKVIDHVDELRTARQTGTLQRRVVELRSCDRDV